MMSMTPEAAEPDITPGSAAPARRTFLRGLAYTEFAGAATAIVAAAWLTWEVRADGARPVDVIAIQVVSLGLAAWLVKEGRDNLRDDRANEAGRQPRPLLGGGTVALAPVRALGPRATRLAPSTLPPATVPDIARVRIVLTELAGFGLTLRAERAPVPLGEAELTDFTRHVLHTRAGYAAGAALPPLALDVLTTMAERAGHAYSPQLVAVSLWVEDVPASHAAVAAAVRDLTGGRVPPAAVDAAIAGLGDEHGRKGLDPSGLARLGDVVEAYLSPLRLMAVGWDDLVVLLLDPDRAAALAQLLGESVDDVRTLTDEDDDSPDLPAPTGQDDEAHRV
jgi:hypothetical protein